MTTSSNAIALMLFRGNHFGHARGSTELVLLLIGIGFAGVLVWAIQRSGRRTA